MFGFSHAAQSQAIITSWTRNTTAKTSSYWYRSGNSGPFTLTATTDSADCVKVIYSRDSVWIYSHGMTDRMGAYQNPGTCIAQTYVHRFPRKQIVQTTKTVSPKGGQIGMLLNGIPIYGLGDGKSWNGSTNTNGGSGVWNGEVYLGEGVSLDTAFTAHPQQAGAYHTHAAPKRLYQNYSSSVHSPIIGWAFDGYPVYGPYGYSTATNASSAISRMKSGYSLRNITTRTTLPSIPSGGGSASQTGPAVSTTYPLGTFVEDYEWLSSNGGDLDQYNSRYCVTPEFPSGTYAYFVTVSATGTPAFPYIIGPYYYGLPVTADFPTGAPGGTTNGLTLPTSAGVYNYTGGTPLPIKLIQFSGREAGDENVLSCTIAKASALQTMTIERSADGASFFTIGDFARQMQATEETTEYHYTDIHPLRNGYYRVRFAEADGQISYSPIVAISRRTSASYGIYPTEVSSTLQIYGPESEAATISIVNASGRMMMQRTFNSNGGHNIVDIAALPAGLYFVRIQSASTSFAGKFIRL